MTYELKFTPSLPEGWWRLLRIRFGNGGWHDIPEGQQVMPPGTKVRMQPAPGEVSTAFEAEMSLNYFIE